MLEHFGATSGEALLAAYRPGNAFFWAGPGQTLLAQWEDDDVLDGRLDTAALLASARVLDADLIVGALPFDPSEPAHLIAPRSVRRAAPMGEAPRGDLTLGDHWSLTPYPTPQGYASAVGLALDELGRGALDKVVLARTLEISAANDFCAAEIVRSLVARNPRACTFSLGCPDGATFLGATPELLIAKEGSKIISRPLAGSLPRSHDAATDRRQAQQLRQSAKDLREHALVVEAISAALAPYCRSLTVEQPELVRTPAMWHLATTISGELQDPAVSSLELARALHPTPAICGAPTQAAMDLIHQLEPFRRGLFAGAIGWNDASGDGVWMVAIRCAEVLGSRLRLYAGAGIVLGSDPEAEAAETEAKFGTMLQAMGLSQAREAVA